jgi:hypothetical protein
MQRVSLAAASRGGACGRSTACFSGFFSSKEQVQKAYPKLVWRRKNATWSMVRIDDMDAKAKKAELAVLFKKGEPARISLLRRCLQMVR